MVRTLVLLSAVWLWSLQASPSPDLQESIQKLVSVHKKWGSGMNTPGASAVAKPDEGKNAMKTERSEAGYLMVSYLIHTSGLSKSKIYRLVLLPFPGLQPQVQMSGIGLNSEGVAVCPGRPNTCSSEEGPDDPIDLIVPSAKGQVQHFALVSEDGKDRAMFTLNPFPIHAQNEGCTVELQRLLPRAELVYLVAKGLPSSGELDVNSDSEGEKHGSKAKADSDGTYEAGLLPAVQGKDHGTLHVKVASATCKLSASIDWGKGSDKPE